MSDLGLFLSQQGLSSAAFAAALEQIMVTLGYPAEPVTSEAVRRWTLPAGAPDFRRPKRSYTQGIYVLTAGKIRPEAFADLPKLDAQIRSKADAILASVKANFAQKAHAGRAKGARIAAKSRARTVRAKAGAR